MDKLPYVDKHGWTRYSNFGNPAGYAGGLETHLPCGKDCLGCSQEVDKKIQFHLRSALGFAPEFEGRGNHQQKMGDVVKENCLSCKLYEEKFE